MSKLEFRIISREFQVKRKPLSGVAGEALMTGGIDVQIKQLEERLQRNPLSLAFSRLAENYRKTGDLQKSIAVLTDGISRNPEYTTGRLILASCYLQQKNFDKAENEYIEIFKHDRHNLLALKTLADIFSKQDKKEKAGNLYSFLLTRDPSNPSLIHLCKMFPGNGNTDIQAILGLGTENVPHSSSAGTSVSETQETNETISPADTSVMDNEPGISGDEMSRHIDDLLSGQTTVSGSNEILNDTPDSQASEQPPITNVSETPVDFDSGEIPSVSAPASTGGTDLIAIVPAAGDAAQDQTDSITGEDFGLRMDSLFGDEPAAEIEAVPEPAPQAPASETVLPVNTNIDTNEEEPLSGTDVSSRLDDLFNTPDTIEPQTVQQPADTGFDTSELLDTVEHTVDGDSVSSQKQPPATESLFIDDTPAASSDSEADNPFGIQLPEVDETDISGSDISGRIDDILGEAASQSDKIESSYLLENGEGAPFEPPLVDVQSFSDTAALEFKEPETIIEDLPGLSPETVIEETGTGQPSNEEMSPIGFETSIPEPAADSAVISSVDLEDSVSEDTHFSETDSSTPMSGDDIADRFDMILGQSETGTDASEPAIQQPLYTQPAELSELSEEFTMSIPQPADVPGAVSIDEPESVNVMDTGSDRLQEQSPQIPDHEELPPPIDICEPVPVMPENTNPEYLAEPNLPPPIPDSAIINSSGEEILATTADSHFEALGHNPREGFEETEKIALDNFRAAPNHDHAQKIYLARKPEGRTTREDLEFVSERTEKIPTADQKSLSSTDQEINQIPDHVLTPTLADIYFQQGQPALASRIYRRLIEKYPDNQQMRQRLIQIESAMADQPPDNTQAPQAGPDLAWFKSPVKETQKKHVAHSGKRRVHDDRPLRGVRIRKTVKEKLHGRRKGS